VFVVDVTGIGSGLIGIGNPSFETVNS